MNLILAVLRVAPAEASKACRVGMASVHALEHQARVAGADLEFAYQNAVQLCGADANRVCRDRQGSGTGCAVLGWR